MDVERGNVCNQFLVSSVMVCLYAPTKVVAGGHQVGGTGFLPPALPRTQFGLCIVRTKMCSKN